MSGGFPELGGARAQVATENAVLARWKATGLFARSQARRKDAPTFTFYEGPPTANGKPGIHHVLARTLKDVVCRYHDLAGRRVDRKAGWDTHGLPVEVQVEKELGIHGKADIEAYGLEPFTKKCIDSVFRYTADWEALTDRIGYWLDLESAYVTCHEPYVESVWWAVASLWKKGLLHQGHKVVWWWPGGGTALSAGEVGDGYKDVEDPSVTVRFKEVGGDRAFLAWTTTPWTLPSNVGLAVSAEGTYVDVRLAATDTDPEERVVVGEALLASVVKNRAHEIVATMKGADLVGKKYVPPFAFATPEGGRAHEIIAADFVTFDGGTGIVHLAPAFGEDDMRAAKEAGLGFLQLVAPDGTMAACVTPVAGVFCKKADPLLVKELKTAGLLFASERVRHAYPFCWRKMDDPLIQYARKSWYVKTTVVKDRMLALNAEVAWHPPTIGEGRFGDFLRHNVDWAVSRERFWGTPLPIWINDVTGAADVVESVEDILARNPSAFDAFDAARAKDPSMPLHLRVHKPWIDHVTWTKPGEPGVWRRVPEVLDCWFDSGAMPFAQRGWPRPGSETFESTFPADFICEGIDQTRGWFYSLLAISTLLFDQAPYKHVLVNGHINDKHGKKMSKSLGNTIDPWTILDAHGADPLRWYLLATTPPHVAKSFDPDGVAETGRKVFGTLWPSYAFFAMYANLDGWKPSDGAPSPERRPTLDRWLLATAHATLRDYRASMEAYDPQRAVRALGELVDKISNWYIRRNRARFWKSTDADDKKSAFSTLHEALRLTALMMGPVAPFSADELWRALHPDDADASVFLSDLPDVDSSLIDDALLSRMDAALEIVALGRSVRTTSNLRVRQPLARIVAAGPTAAAKAALSDRDVVEAIKDELNVKVLEVADARTDVADFTLKPNLPSLGPRLGKKLGAAKSALAAPPKELLDALLDGRSGELLVDGTSFTIEPKDVLVECRGRGAFVASAERGWMVALDTTVTPDLQREGLAREVLNRVQGCRKDAALDVADRIRLEIDGDADVVEAATAFRGLLLGEALGLSLDVVPALDGTVLDVDGRRLVVKVTRA